MITFLLFAPMTPIFCFLSETSFIQMSDRHLQTNFSFLFLLYFEISAILPSNFSIEFSFVIIFSFQKLFYIF